MAAAAATPGVMPGAPAYGGTAGPANGLPLGDAAGLYSCGGPAGGT